jgi:hypothetical protein
VNASMKCVMMTNLIHRNPTGSSRKPMGSRLLERHFGPGENTETSRCGMLELTFINRVQELV